MHIPSFADSKNRTANQPAIMLGIVQTSILLTEARQYIRENQINATPYKVLRDHLIQSGWYRVELQGQQLYLQAVVVYANESPEQLDAYLEQARLTGNYNWPDFIKKPVTPDQPNLRLVRSAAEKDDENSQG
jgi:hypothetical protein